MKAYSSNYNSRTNAANNDFDSANNKALPPTLSFSTNSSLILGTTNLQSFLDCRIVVVLRDGRKFFGVLRSYDQFGNLVMTDVYERYYVDLEYGEEYRGVYLIRGENVVLVGELDEEEFQSISKRMARFRRPLDVILPKFKALSQKSTEIRMRLDQLGLSELMDQDNY